MQDRERQFLEELYSMYNDPDANVKPGANGFDILDAMAEAIRCRLDQNQKVVEQQPSQDPADIIRGLLTWADQMGGWEAPCWADAARFIGGDSFPDRAEWTKVEFDWWYKAHGDTEVHLKKDHKLGWEVSVLKGGAPHPTVQTEYRIDFTEAHSLANGRFNILDAGQLVVSPERKVAEVTDKAVSEQEVVILQRLHAYGEAVIHTTSGFELDRGEFLCRMVDMTALKRKGLVETSRLPNGVNQYWLSQRGVDLVEGKLTDVVAVIGLKNRSTELVESLCRSIGMNVFYAMKKEAPSQRIDSCDEESTVSSPFEALPENVFRLGLMASNRLFEDGTLDCNLTEERDMFVHTLGWVAHRVKSPAELPTGWVLVDSPKHAGFDPQVDNSATGRILAGGKMVVDFGQGKRLLQIPDDYRDVFSSLEGFGV